MENRIMTLVINETVEQDIKKRDENGNFSEVVVRDLSRLYTMYYRALQDTELTVSEAMVICEVLNKTALDVDKALDLWTAVEKVCRSEKLHTAWDIEDYSHLVHKLKSLPLIACMAIIDAAEQFWLTSDYSDGGIYGVARRLFFCAEEVCPFSDK